MTIKFTVMRPGLISVSYTKPDGEESMPCYIAKRTDKLWQVVHAFPDKGVNIDQLNQIIDADYQVVKRKVTEVLEGLSNEQ